MSKLKKCPFCKSKNVDYEVNAWDFGYIVCYDCHAQGPSVLAVLGANSKAAGLWNKAVRK